MSSVLDSTSMKQSEAANSFRVWLRPTGWSWKISVENSQGAKLLTQRLTQNGFKTTDLVQDGDNLHCTFRCVSTSRLERDCVESLLLQWPQVKLQHSPEFFNVSDYVALTPELSADPLHRPAQPQNIQTEIRPFKVWVRPLGNAWRLRISGADQCDWLRRELTHRGLVCSTPSQIPDTSMVLLRCMSETAHESSYVWNLLKALPQVLLQNGPA